jgi:hypothetical protein
VPVEAVVAEVQLAVLHPLDLDLAVVDAEVVLQEVLLRRQLLPVELLEFKEQKNEALIGTIRSRVTRGLFFVLFSLGNSWGNYFSKLFLRKIQIFPDIF